MPAYLSFSPKRRFVIPLRAFFYAKKGWVCSYGFSFVPVVSQLTEFFRETAGRSHGWRSRPAPRTALGRVKPKVSRKNSVSWVDKEQEKSHMNAPAPSPVRQTKKALNGLIFTSEPETGVKPLQKIE